MTAEEPSPSDVHIRDVDDGELEVFFDHQLHPEAWSRLLDQPLIGR